MSEPEEYRIAAPDGVASHRGRPAVLAAAVTSAAIGVASLVLVAGHAPSRTHIVDPHGTTVTRGAEADVVEVDGLPVSGVPVGLTLDGGICDTPPSTHTVCWGGVIPDATAAAAALQQHSNDRMVLTVQVLDGPQPGLAGAPQSTTSVVDGVTVTYLSQSIFTFVSFNTADGRSAQIRAQNIDQTQVASIVTGMLGG